VFAAPPVPDLVLPASAALIALVHTVIGVDHVVPFVALSRARGWSLRRTLGITAVCGLAHTGSSVLLGLGGVALGLGLDPLIGAETSRANLAAWLLIALGLAWTGWGVWRLKSVAHTHRHAAAPLAVSALVAVFIVGPCEPLVPLMMAPTVTADWTALALVTSVFSVVTVATMVALVALASVSLRRLTLGAFERYGDILAGGAIALTGVLMATLPL
jgi:nickel/cobalt exporter